MTPKSSDIIIKIQDIITNESIIRIYTRIKLKSALIFENCLM